MLRVRVEQAYQRYRSSNLLKSGSWYLVASFAQRGLGFLAVYLFSRLLTTEQYGTVSVFMPWLTIFGSTITLNVYASVARARYDFKDEEFARFLSASVSLGTATSLLALILIGLLPEALLGPIFGLPKILVLLAVLLAASEISVNSSLSVWQIDYKYQRYSIVSFGLALSKILLSLLFILAPLAFLRDDRALARILGMTGVSIVAGLYLFARILATGRTLIHSGYWRYALTYSLPLIPHVLSGLILAQMDRLLIDRFIGRSEAGLYTLAYQIGELVTLMWTATNAAWVPWFYEQMEKKNDALIRRRANQYLIGFTVITAAVTIAGPWLLTLLAPQEYWSTRAIVPVVMGGMFFNLTYAFYANVEFFVKKTVYISIGTTLAAAINVGLNVVLLPKLGYRVAAWTTLIACVFLFLVHAWFVIFRLRINKLFDFRLMAMAGAGIIALTTVVYLLAQN